MGMWPISHAQPTRRLWPCCSHCIPLILPVSSPNMPTQATLRWCFDTLLQDDTVSGVPFKCHLGTTLLPHLGSSGPGRHRGAVLCQYQQDEYCHACLLRLSPGTCAAAPNIIIATAPAALPHNLRCDGDPAKMAHSYSWWLRHQARRLCRGQHLALDCQICLQTCQVPCCCAEAGTQHIVEVISGRPASVEKMSVLL